MCCVDVASTEVNSISALTLRCDAWRELVPAANSCYATRQSARFFKHKQTLGFMELICFSSNIGIFDPSPYPIMLAYAISTFQF